MPESQVVSVIPVLVLSLSGLVVVKLVLDF